MNELNVKMTVIADEIRELSGGADKIGLDAMATNVDSANGEIASQKELLEQAVAALEGKVDPELYDKGYASGASEERANFCSFIEGGAFDVPTNAKTIRAGAFYTCVGVTAVEFPFATSVGANAFLGCDNLTTINFPMATFVGTNAFTRCLSLKTVNLPLVTDMEDYAFNSCKGLETITLPLVKSIGRSALGTCTMLKVVDLPSVTNIGNTAFNSCPDFETLILRSNTVCNLVSTDAFNGNPIQSKPNDGFVYVPDNLVDDYKAATNWSTYANKIKPISELEVTA